MPVVFFLAALVGGYFYLSTKTQPDAPEIPKTKKSRKKMEVPNGKKKSE